MFEIKHRQVGDVVVIDLPSQGFGSDRCLMSYVVYRLPNAKKIVFNMKECKKISAREVGEILRCNELEKVLDGQLKLAEVKTAVWTKLEKLNVTSQLDICESEISAIASFNQAA